MIRWGLCTFTVLSLAACGSREADTADAAPKRPQAYAQCVSCHTDKKGGRDTAGPNLFGVMGSKAGERSSKFAYSPAMKASGIVWTPETLDAFLAAPAQHIPGTRMFYPGMKDAAQRKAIIAYLDTLR